MKKIKIYKKDPNIYKRKIYSQKMKKKILKMKNKKNKC